MGILEAFIVRLFVGILGWLAQRHDLRERVKAEIALQGAEAALDAMGWKVTALGDPAHYGELPVTDGAPTITGWDAPGQRPGADRDAKGSPLPPQ